MARKDVTDLMVCQAAKDRESGFVGLFLTDILMMRTGQPRKVVMAAIMRAYDRDLLIVGVSFRTARLSDKGRELLAGTLLE